MQHERFWGTTARVLAVCAITLILMASGSATSQQKVLYTFQGIGDGENPTSGLIFDGQGNLYGTTVGLGHDFGNVFKLTHNQYGSWTQSVLYSFHGETGDGQFPRSSVVFDQAGNV